MNYDPTAYSNYYDYSLVIDLIYFSFKLNHKMNLIRRLFLMRQIDHEATFPCWTVLMAWYNPEMEKAADMFVLFFSAGANL